MAASAADSIQRVGTAPHKKTGSLNRHRKVGSAVPRGAIHLQNSETWIPERRSAWRYQIDPRTYRLSGSPEAWGLPITVSFNERDLKGYCNQIAEGGLGACLPEEVLTGSAVLLQFVVPSQSTEVRVQAVVRHQEGLQHGLAFTSLNEEEKRAIREVCNELPRLPDKRLGNQRAA